MTREPLDLSIIVPVKDEAESIPDLASEITNVMEQEGWHWECIWVDDGSTDETLRILIDLHARDRRHKYIALARNTGQSAALWIAFRSAKGKILGTLDGDGQNDPADLPRLVEALKNGDYDMANGYRMRRRDSFPRRTASRIANGFRNHLTGKTVRDVGCSTRVFKARCVENLPLFKGLHRFLPTLVVMQGYRITEMAVRHRPRRRGISKYTINNRLWVGLADTFGVMWLRKRGFRIGIKCRSEEGRGEGERGDSGCNGVE